MLYVYIYRERDICVHVSNFWLSPIPSITTPSIISSAHLSPWTALWTQKSQSSFNNNDCPISTIVSPVGRHLSLVTITSICAYNQRFATTIWLLFKAQKRNRNNITSMSFKTLDMTAQSHTTIILSFPGPSTPLHTASDQYSLDCMSFYRQLATVLLSNIDRPSIFYIK